MLSPTPFESVDPHRRGFIRAAAAATLIPLVVPAKGLAQPTNRIVDQLLGTGKGFQTLKRVKAGLLDVSYAELGPAGGQPVILLHGWPYDIHSFIDVAPALAADGYRVLVPHLRGYGPTRFLADASLRNGQPAALAQDAIDFMDALRIDRALFGGFDWGARTAGIVAALWPERTNGLVSVSGYLISGQEAGRAPLPPEAEFQWWYQFYFATERGRLGYERNRSDFAKLIWQLASPKWGFDEATFQRSAASFDNPDHVAIVVHNYRWRLALADGEKRYEAIDRRISSRPDIAIPTITMEGDANGAPHPEPSSYAAKFKGAYEHRTIGGGIGHNLPQEAPSAFVAAIRDVGRLAAPGRAG